MIREDGRERPLEAMTFEEVEGDPVYGPVLQQKALEYLQTEQSDFFEREFTGEVDADGYLVRRDGVNPNTKPSQNISGPAVERVLEMLKMEIG